MGVIKAGLCRPDWLAKGGLVFSRSEDAKAPRSRTRDSPNALQKVTEHEKKCRRPNHLFQATRDTVAGRLRFRR
ncbi:hypothetical protein MRX96_029697 [Rhipicephalus microplus]